jgi:hypothetical protein
LWKAGAAIGAPKPFIAPNGSGPALVRFANSNAVGLVMPTPSDAADGPSVAPDWALPTKVMLETAAAE